MGIMNVLLFFSGLAIPSGGLQHSAPNSDKEINMLRATGNRRQSRQTAAAFSDFMATHSRDYLHGSAEYENRLKLFEMRVAEVEMHNSRTDRLWTAVVNKFSDRTDEELSAYRGWARRGQSAARSQRHENTGCSQYSSGNLPAVSRSWLEYHNAFIRDQGMCGSCWAVTATTVLGWHSELYATNQSFSTQEIVDCVPNPNDCGGSGGCDGATVELAFQYVMSKGCREVSVYGNYNAIDGECDWTPTSNTNPSLEYLTKFSSDCGIFEATHDANGHEFGMVAWIRLESNKVLPLLHAVNEYGPVAVAVSANNFNSYGGGIFDGCTDDWIVNHAVTLVGYGVEDGNKYWQIQNSWGSTWGEGGWIRLLRKDNEEEEKHCGMDTNPQAGLACEGEDEPVKVCGSCGILYDSVFPNFTR